MADDKFEIRPQPFREEHFQVATPNFGELLQRDTQNANGLKGADGLLAKGILPDVQMALQETGHKPDDLVHKQLPGVGQLDLTYDDHGKLASAHLDEGQGNSEDAKFVDGHIVENRLQGLFNADFHFNADGTIASEAFAPSSGANEYYEFDKNGNVTLSVESNPDLTSTVLRNEPDDHSVQILGNSGNRATFNFDANQQFQNGELTLDGDLYGLRPRKDGGAEATPETRL